MAACKYLLISIMAWTKKESRAGLSARPTKAHAEVTEQGSDRASS
jgi:hypothetical protein